MKKFYLLFSFSILFFNFSFAQKDSTLKEHIRALVYNEPSVKIMQPDSVEVKGSDLKIYFSTNRSFSVGDISETESEMLMETLVSLTTETNTSNIFLYAREKASGQWKTLDYFVAVPTPETIKPRKNNDAFPEVPGSQPLPQKRVYPGSGQPVSGGALTGKTVWLSPGHGWQNTGSGFNTQRGTTNLLVEDFTTAESMDYYLLHYLVNAGANVWSVRERDVNTREIIVNNDQGAPAYVETGSWVDGTIPGYGGTYRAATASATQSATAVYTPTIAASGLYWVSVRFVSGANRATDVKYTIRHAGGTTVFKMNQEVHGDTWNYLGQFYFFAGESYSITISNESGEAGQAVIADAVRLGGGIGADPDCLNGGLPSNKPRFEESARQYARYQGNPACREDVTVRPTYAEYELNKGTELEKANAVFVSFHTNAGGGTGTETYRYNGGGSSQPLITPGSTQLRDSIHKQLVADIRAGWRSTWSDRGVKEANFGELRELRSIPGTLVELAFHDHTGDAADLRNPEFRRLSARAIYKGIVKYFHYRDGTPIVFLPEEPRQVAAKNIGGGKIQVSWTAPLSGSIFGHPATGYRLYVSENGKGFSDPIEVSGNSYTFSAQAGKAYYFKVSATNSGGESFASPVVGARTPVGNAPVKFLIVDGFDRIDASAMILKNEGGSLGNVRRMFLENMNSYDYMIDHGKGFSSCDISFDGVQNEVVSAGNVNLLHYYAVDWFVGEESTADRTLDAVERQKLKEYLDDGGRLLISGSEIAWDLGRAASVNADLSFFTQYLKAVYVGDGSATYSFGGTPGFFNGSTGTYSNGTNGYNVDFPDRLDSINGSRHVLKYLGGTADVAGVGFQGNFNLLYYGFPVEAVVNEQVRNSLICQSAAFLAAEINTPAPGVVLSGMVSSSLNKLRWTTQSEDNISHFVLEKSSDGLNFQPMGLPFASLGTPTSGHMYETADASYFPVTYYRVKVVSNSGREKFSNMVVLENTRANQLYTIVENPAKSIIRVRTNVLGKINLVLTNSQGQVVYQGVRQVNHNGDIVIPIGSLPTGIYYLTIYSQDFAVKTFTVMIQ